MIGLVTDSNSQIPDWLRERFAVDVVPLTVTIDGEEFLEGVDLDADGFYARYAAASSAPTVTTSQPSPGAFALAYQRLVDHGCDEIVSIHLGSTMSGTVASARLAAGEVSGAEVHVVDTGSASFGVSVCVWEAGLAVAAGTGARSVRAAIERIGPLVGTAFMIGVPLLTERGGRATGVELDGDGIPVLSMSGGSLDVLSRVSTVEDTIDVMATYAAGWVDRVGAGVTVAVGIADPPSRPLAARLAVALAGLPGVDETVEYRVGPSIGAHTGPGTFGLFVFPTPGAIVRPQG